MNKLRDQKNISRTVLDQSPEKVAKDLLGCLIVTTQTVSGKTQITGGIISETEAYLAENDSAAHNSRGKTNANRSLFDTSGTLYIHPMRAHLLMDIVTEDSSLPGSVLLRAIRPVLGVDLMIERRNNSNIEKFAIGPGNLCKALGVLRIWDGMNIFDRDCPVKIFEQLNVRKEDIKTSTRIGISKNEKAPLRFQLVN